MQLLGPLDFKMKRGAPASDEPLKKRKTLMILHSSPGPSPELLGKLYILGPTVVAETAKSRYEGKRLLSAKLAAR